MECTAHRYKAAIDKRKLKNGQTELPKFTEPSFRAEVDADGDTSAIHVSPVNERSFYKPVFDKLEARAREDGPQEHIDVKDHWAECATFNGAPLETLGVQPFQAPNVASASGPRSTGRKRKRPAITAAEVQELNDATDKMLRMMHVTDAEARRCRSEAARWKRRQLQRTKEGGAITARNLGKRLAAAYSDHTRQAGKERVAQAKKLQRLLRAQQKEREQDTSWLEASDSDEEEGESAAAPAAQAARATTDTVTAATAPPPTQRAQQQQGGGVSFAAGFGESRTEAVSRSGRIRKVITYDH